MAVMSKHNKHHAHLRAMNIDELEELGAGLELRLAALHLVKTRQSSTDGARLLADHRGHVVTELLDGVHAAYAELSAELDRDRDDDIDPTHTDVEPEQVAIEVTT